MRAEETGAVALNSSSSEILTCQRLQPYLVRRIVRANSPFSGAVSSPGQKLHCEALAHLKSENRHDSLRPEKNKGKIMRLARREKQDRGALAPRNELSRIRNEIDRLFENPFSLMAPGTSFFEGWTPALDVYEDKDKITVKTELPGMKKEEIDVSLDGNTLTISGERKSEEEKKDRETYRSERYFGRFQRSITLPTPVETTKIEANYREGILTVSLPKSEEAKPKQIPVKTT
jgi:HSP20 family protein